MGQLNPTRQEIMDAHQALETLAAHGYMSAMDRKDEDSTRKCEEAIRKLLPPIPRPTMAEIDWDDEKHFLAEAEHEDGSDTIMLWKTTSGCISIIRNGLVGAVYPDTLTPTGRRYELQEEE